ncbi:MAG: hypothetical protein ACYCZU_02545 [Devosia sp.]
MAWYLNHYECDSCGGRWDDEWSCCCDDECPHCGARNMSPYDSDDLTFQIERQDHLYIVYESPPSAEDKPRYEDVAVALSHSAALVYVEFKRSQQ